MRRYLAYALIIGTFCYLAMDGTTKVMLTKLLQQQEQSE